MSNTKVSKLAEELRITGKTRQPISPTFTSKWLNSGNERNKLTFARSSAFPYEQQQNHLQTINLYKRSQYTILYRYHLTTTNKQKNQKRVLSRE